MEGSLSALLSSHVADKRGRPSRVSNTYFSSFSTDLQLLREEVPEGNLYLLLTCVARDLQHLTTHNTHAHAHAHAHAHIHTHTQISEDTPSKYVQLDKPSTLYVPPFYLAVREG